MHITLVIFGLITGGAERVITVMANYWARHDQDVTLITLASQDLDCYALHPRVKRIGLHLEMSSQNIAEAVLHNATIIKRLRSEIRASFPDVVISFGDITNVLTLLGCVGLRVPVIVSERSDPRQRPLGFAWIGLRYLLYPRAAVVILQSQGLRDWARQFVKETAVHVIPNPVGAPLTGSDRPLTLRGINRTVVAIGRLSRVKGFDLLIRAFAKCANTYAAWSLIILGEGEERASLEALVAELGLKDRVSFPGRVRDPGPILQGADLFVLSSRYEGLPNSLLEAMACGLPVISTDCASSLREVIRDGVNGILVSSNDIDALATAMHRLMANQAERQRLGARAVDVLERFSVKKIMNMWDDVLTQTCRVPTHE